MDLDENDECGDKYGWATSRRKNGVRKYRIEYVNVTWNWFTCHKNRRCIHSNSRCDLHPNPACIYENEAGQMVAEDEEGCLDEYKSKGLLAKSGNFECESALHNSDTIAIVQPILGRMLPTGTTG